MLPTGLTSDQVRQFISDGFVRIDGAFPPRLADQARTILWRDLPGRADDAATWTRPVVRLGMYDQPPFVQAANTPILHAAFDQLVGAGRWLPLRAMGTFPVRFPSTQDAGDTGWHIDMSFGTEAPDFMDWRINVDSRGRRLLMLFLFSDVGESDAPTRIRRGSQRHIARALSAAGASGLTLRELILPIEQTGALPEVTACGAAGTVYLCHPFLVHAAQSHRGSRPRFLAQPPLLPGQPQEPLRAGGDPLPIELAVRQPPRVGADPE